jgi:Uncharacterised protein family (UPF0158)
MTADIRFDNFDDDDDDLDEGDALALTNTARVFSVQALIAAWQDDGPDNLYYIDTESGAVILVNPNLYNLKELTDEIERHKYRYLYLPKPAPDQLREDLRDFQNTIDDKKLKSILDMAFESPHILSSFNKILNDSDSTKVTALTEFREGRVRLRIKQWMEANSLADRWSI